MNLRILVTEAAYADQQNNSLIVYELVPRYMVTKNLLVRVMILELG